MDVNNLSPRDVLKAVSLVLVVGFLGVVFFVNQGKSTGTNASAITNTRVTLEGGIDKIISVSCKAPSDAKLVEDLFYKCSIKNKMPYAIDLYYEYKVRSKCYNKNGEKTYDNYLTVKLDPEGTSNVSLKCAVSDQIVDIKLGPG